jgi:hypothetical protein
MTANETSRERWVRRTRESVHRYLAGSRVPESAQSIEDNLDIGVWTSIGLMDRRSAREINAALRWLVAQGYATALPKEHRDPYDPPGKLYQLTRTGRDNVPAKEEAR